MVRLNHLWGINYLVAALLVCSVTALSNGQGTDEIHCPPVCGCGGVLNHRAVEMPEPIYPSDAKRRGIEGTVTVLVIVDKEGRIERAKACFGPKELRRAATDAAYKARVKPTKLDGVPVKTNGVLVYIFRRNSS